ncbi:MAG: SMP-30/gluconolactonase/LRE family protein [Acidimicrobiales bacterium]
MHSPELLLDHLAFPEGPRWHDGWLWFSDVTNKRVERVDLEGHREVVATFDDRPSGLGFLPDGSLLVVAMTQRCLLRVTDGRVEPYADLRDFGGDFANDMVVDADGRAYVGVRSAALKPDLPVPPPQDAPDLVVVVDPSGNPSVGADQMVAPNGTVITPDGRTLIIAETYAHRLTAFDRAHDGTLSRRRVFAEVAGVYPDGICLDDEGAVWVGSPYSDEFIRVRDGGEITDRLTVAGGVACALGGPFRKTLFLLAVDSTALPKPGTSMSTAPVLHGDTVFDGGSISTVPVDRSGAGWP